MHWLRSLILLPLPLAAALPAFAACAHADYSLRGEFRRAGIVATVVVTEEVWLDANRRPAALKPPLRPGDQPRGLDPYAGAYYTANLRRAYKGDPPRRFRIFSENTSGRTPLRLRTPLLLFITRSPSGDDYVRAGDLVVDSCGNSAVAATVPERLRRLERLARRR